MPIWNSADAGVLPRPIASAPMAAKAPRKAGLEARRTVGRSAIWPKPPTGLDFSSLFWLRATVYARTLATRVYNHFIAPKKRLPKSIAVGFPRISATVAEKPRTLRRRSFRLRPAE